LAGCGEDLVPTSPAVKALTAGQPSENGAVFFLIDPNTGAGCTGTAVLEGRAILTAQHCSIDYDTLYTSSGDPAAEIETFVRDGILGILHHPDLDITLLVLEEPVEHFADLIETPLTKADGPFTVVGFGGPDFGKKNEGEVEKLYHVDPLELRSRTEVNGTGGDSGGPLFYNDRLAGVMVNARNTVLANTIYVHVDGIRDWVEEAAARCLEEGGDACLSQPHRIAPYVLKCASGATPRSVGTTCGIGLFLLVILVALRRAIVNGPYRRTR
ncbi:MAG: hypothetical protein A2284_13675, partial [Deltaproteobacteria bacterium RIFOXYA12_FULL_61_11]